MFCKGSSWFYSMYALFEQGTFCHLGNCHALQTQYISFFSCLSYSFSNCWARSCVEMVPCIFFFLQIMLKSLYFCWLFSLHPGVPVFLWLLLSLLLGLLHEITSRHLYDDYLFLGVLLGFLFVFMSHCIMGLHVLLLLNLKFIFSTLREEKMSRVGTYKQTVWKGEAKIPERDRRATH